MKTKRFFSYLTTGSTALSQAMQSITVYKLTQRSFTFRNNKYRNMYVWTPILKCLILYRVETKRFILYITTESTSWPQAMQSITDYKLIQRSFTFRNNKECNRYVWTPILWCLLLYRVETKRFFLYLTTESTSWPQVMQSITNYKLIQWSFTFRDNKYRNRYVWTPIH